MSCKKENSFYVRLPLFPRGVFKKGTGEFEVEGYKSKPLTKKTIEDGERREWKSGRGRKYGSGEILPSRIVGYVDTLVEKKEAKHVHDAFLKVSEVTGYTEDTVKKIYYDTLKRDEYRHLTEWTDLGTSNSSNEPVDFEEFLSNLKHEMGRGTIIHPDYMDMEFVRSTYGHEKLMKLLTVYIEEAEKLLDKNDETFIMQGARKTLQENKLIERARHLMVQLG